MGDATGLLSQALATVNQTEAKRKKGDKNVSCLPIGVIELSLDMVSLDLVERRDVWAPWGQV